MDNPVAPVADAGVFRHRGRYCLIGVRTNGEGFVSNDLVRWRDADGRVLERSPGMVRDWGGGFPMWPRDDHVYSHAYLNGLHHLHHQARHIIELRRTIPPGKPPAPAL